MFYLIINIKPSKTGNGRNDGNLYDKCVIAKGHLQLNTIYNFVFIILYNELVLK